MNRRDFLRRTSALTAVAAVAPAALLTQSSEPVAESAAYQMTAIHFTAPASVKFDDWISTNFSEIYIAGRNVVEVDGRVVAWGDARSPEYGPGLIANRGAGPTVVSLHKL